MRECEDCKLFQLCNPSYKSMQNCDDCLNYKERFDSEENDTEENNIIIIEYEWKEMSYYIFSDNSLDYLEDIDG